MSAPRSLLVVNEMVMEEERAHVLQTIAMLRAFSGARANVNYIWPDFGRWVPGLAKLPITLSPRRCRFRRRTLRYPEFLLRLMPLFARHRGQVFSRSGGVAIVASAFGNDVVLELHQPPKPAMRTALRLMGRGVRIVAISARLAREIETLLGRPAGSIVASHLGVDAGAFSAAQPLPDRPLPERRTDIVHFYYGALAPDRGALLIASAAQALPHHGFVLAGPADPALVERLELDRFNVRLVGSVPHADVPRLLRSYDSALLPYLPSISTGDWFSSLKLFEIMASGTPMVASDMPTIREVLDDSTGLLFDPEDTDSFVAALRTVATDRARALDRAGKAQEKARLEYSWDARARGILDMFGT